MKYIVWELISPHDGYFTTEYATWEEAIECVKTIMTAPHVRLSAQAKKQYNEWLAGKLGKISVLSGKGERQSVEIEIFITSMPLTEPLW